MLKLDVREFSPGTYILKLKGKNAQEIQRFIKS